MKNSENFTPSIKLISGAYSSLLWNEVEELLKIESNKKRVYTAFYIAMCHLFFLSF